MMMGLAVLGLLARILTLFVIVGLLHDLTLALRFDGLTVRRLRGVLFAAAVLALWFVVWAMVTFRSPIVPFAWRWLVDYSFLPWAWFGLALYRFWWAVHRDIRPPRKDS